MVPTQPIRKKNSTWRLYLFLAGLGYAVAFGVEAVVINIFASPFPSLIRIGAVVVPALVFLGIVLLMTKGTKIFPWRYTIFGPYERTPAPKGFRSQIRFNVYPKRPGYITQMAVGKEGVELTFFYGSRGFLPASAITAIGPADGQTYLVEHDSSEISSPLVVSQQMGEAIFAALQGKIAQESIQSPAPRVQALATHSRQRLGKELDSQERPIRKKNCKWLVYLSAAGLGLFSIWALAVGIAYMMLRDSPPARDIAVLIPTIIALAICLVVLLGSRIFAWRYSAFGPYDRSPPPKDFRPRISMSVAMPDVQGAIRYEVAKEGVEITYVRSRVFIPACAILAIVPAGWRLYSVHHDCPEIESPLSMSKEIAEAILAGLGRADPVA